MYFFHMIVDSQVNSGVHGYPHIIHNLWKKRDCLTLLHILKHKYNTKKKRIMQRFFDTYPQYPSLVDNVYPHHYIL